jgi:hypothetical protein
VSRTTVRSSARQQRRYGLDIGGQKEGLSGGEDLGKFHRELLSTYMPMRFRRGMRNRIVVVRGVARRSCSSVIVRAVTISSMQLCSQDHSSWDRKRLAVVCAVGNAPIPRWSIFICIKYEREGTKSKTDLFYRNDDISSWIEGVKILSIVQCRRFAGVWHVQPGTPWKTAALTSVYGRRAWDQPGAGEWAGRHE